MRASTNDIKKDYAQFVAKGMELLHSPQTRDSILQILKGKDPVQLVANATVTIIRKVDSASRAAGIEVQDVTKLFAAHEFVTQICEIAEAARLFTLDQARQELALSVTVQDYVRGEIAAGRIDPAKLHAKIELGVRQLPAHTREEVMASIAKIQKTAASYRG